MNHAKKTPPTLYTSENGWRGSARLLYNFRRKHKLRQSDLAKAIGVTQPRVSRWEEGETMSNFNAESFMTWAFTEYGRRFTHNQMFEWVEPGL